MGVSENAAEVNKTSEAMKKSFGINMSKAMRGSGIMQKKLSEKTGISSGKICQYMSGSLLPDAKTLEKIAKALGVTVNDLVGSPLAGKRNAGCVEKAETAASDAAAQNIPQGGQNEAGACKEPLAEGKKKPEEKTAYVDIDSAEIRRLCEEKGIALSYAGECAYAQGGSKTAIYGILRNGRAPETFVNSLSLLLGVPAEDLVCDKKPEAYSPKTHKFPLLDKAKVKALCSERGISFASLAKKSGIPRQSLYNYLTGVSGIPSNRLKAVAGVLGVRADEIIVSESASARAASKSGKADNRGRGAGAAKESPETHTGRASLAAYACRCAESPNSSQNNSEKGDNNMPAKNQPGGESAAASKKAEYVDLCISNEVKNAETLVSMLMRSPKRDIEGVKFVAENVSYFDGVCDAVSAMCGGHA